MLTVVVLTGCQIAKKDESGQAKEELYGAYAVVGDRIPDGKIAGVKDKKGFVHFKKIKQYQMQKDTAYVIINEQLIGMKGQTINRQKIHSAKKNFTYKWKQLGDDGVLTPTDLKFKK